MSTPEEPAPWLADPTVEWRIVLTAELPDAVSPDLVTERLQALNRRLAGRPGPGLVAPDSGPLLAAVTRTYPDVPVAAGLDRHRLVLAGEHRYADGLAMLAVLAELTGVPAASAARGLGEREEPPFAAEVARRLVEVAVRPPAKVATTASAADRTPTGSTFVDHLLDRRVGVTELVHAAVQGVVAFNREHGQRHRRVAVAIGASAVGGGHVEVADHSALLRLRSAERVDQAAIRSFLASAPTVPSPGASVGGSRPWVARAGVVAVRVLGPRLGSTLTVSHLGDVTSPARALSFYPVAGGSSGVSLGAVTHEGRTRITLRGRADGHSAEGLEALLALVAAPLS